jgi:hypothetical protein
MVWLEILPQQLLMPLGHVAISTRADCHEAGSCRRALLRAREVLIKSLAHDLGDRHALTARDGAQVALSFVTQEHRGAFHVTYASIHRRFWQRCRTRNLWDAHIDAWLDEKRHGGAQVEPRIYAGLYFLKGLR